MSREHGSHRGVDMQIGIMGLGYVGLPLAVAFAEAGETVIGVDVDGRRVEALRQGRSFVEDIDDERAGRHRRPLHGHDAAGRAGARRRGDHLRPDAADAEPRAGPHAAARRGSHARLGPAARPARGPGVHDLPGHHARAPGAAAGGVRPRRRARLRPGLLARAHRPGPRPGELPHDPEGRGRPDARPAATAPRRSTGASSRRSSASPRRRSPRWRSSWRTSSGR